MNMAHQHIPNNAIMSSLSQSQQQHQHQPHPMIILQQPAAAPPNAVAMNAMIPASTAQQQQQQQTVQYITTTAAASHHHHHHPQQQQQQQPYLQYIATANHPQQFAIAAPGGAPMILQQQNVNALPPARHLNHRAMLPIANGGGSARFIPAGAGSSASASMSEVRTFAAMPPYAAVEARKHNDVSSVNACNGQTLTTGAPLPGNALVRMQQQGAPPPPPPPMMAAGPGVLLQVGAGLTGFATSSADSSSLHQQRAGMSMNMNMNMAPPPRRLMTIEQQQLRSIYGASVGSNVQVVNAVAAPVASSASHVSTAAASSVQDREQLGEHVAVKSSLSKIHADASPSASRMMVNADNSGSAADDSSSSTSPRTPSPGAVESSERNSSNATKMINNQISITLSRVESPEMLTSSKHPRNCQTRVKELFPIVLHRILADAEKEGFAEIISFAPHGRSFAIHRMHDFEEKIMPKYFQHARSKSFRR